jgi:hypothetical protein
VSKIFFPKLCSLISFNYEKILKVTVLGFFNKAALLNAMLRTKRATMIVLFIFFIFL